MNMDILFRTVTATLGIAAASGPEWTFRAADDYWIHLKNEIQRDGQKYMRYVFENAKCFQSIKPVPAWLRSLTVLFMPCNGQTVQGILLCSKRPA